uniref:Uncharacterized protein n=1 Tax=Prolemur simus TaxID=1328070 RepID=A0A8C8ZVT1_PROSS
MLKYPPYLAPDSQVPALTCTPHAQVPVLTWPPHSDTILTWPPTSLLLALSLLTWDSAISALSAASSSSCWTLRQRDSCVSLKSFYPVLQFLDLLLPALQRQLLGLVQTVLQVLHRLLQVLLHPLQVGVSLHLLLESDGIVPAPDLSIQRALHRLHNSNVVSLQLVNFLILFSNFPVDFRLDLVQLKLDAQDLSLFVFKRCLNDRRR